MKAKQKIVHGRGPSNLNRGIFFFFACLMFAGRASPNHSHLRASLCLSKHIFRKKKKFSYYKKILKASPVSHRRLVDLPDECVCL